MCYAGRYTLVKHVLNTLPIYTMNTHTIPLVTINRMNTITKKSLWNASNTSHKKSPIKWEVICQPRDKKLKNLKRGLHLKTRIATSG